MASTTRLANEAWEALFRAQMTIKAELDADDAWGSLTSNEYGVLYALSAAGAGLRMSELGSDILLSQPGLSRLVSRLEARGLVERTIDPEDGRASIVQLSKAGLHVQRRAGALHGRRVAQALSTRLCEADLIELKTLCQRLLTPPASSTEPDNGHDS